LCRRGRGDVSGDGRPSTRASARIISPAAAPAIGRRSRATVGARNPKGPASGLPDDACRGRINHGFRARKRARAVPAGFLQANGAGGLEGQGGAQGLGPADAGFSADVIHDRIISMPTELKASVRSRRPITELAQPRFSARRGSRRKGTPMAEIWSRGGRKKGTGVHGA